MVVSSTIIFHTYICDDDIINEAIEKRTTIEGKFSDENEVCRWKTATFHKHKIISCVCYKNYMKRDVRKWGDHPAQLNLN